MKSSIQIWLFSLMPIVFFACQDVKDMEINRESDQILPLPETENIEFRKSWNRWDKPDFGRLYDYHAENKEIIQDTPCLGKFTLDEDGKLYSFNLATDHVVNGTLFPKGSHFSTFVSENNDRTGYLVYLAKDIEAQGYLIRSKGSFVEDYHVNFYLDGSLRSFKPVHDIQIDGIPCKGGKKHSHIELYPNGRLLTCYLAENYVIEGSSFEEGDQIILDEDGKAFEYSRYLYINKLEALNLL